MKRKIVTAVGVLTLSATMAVAAPHGGKRGPHGELSANIARKLNLTDQQKEQIRAIREETRAQNASFFQSYRQTRQELRAAKQANDTARAEALKGTLASQRAQMKQIRDAERQRILALLTPEQRAQYEQRETRRGARHH